MTSTATIKLTRQEIEKVIFSLSLTKKVSQIMFEKDKYLLSQLIKDFNEINYMLKDGEKNSFEDLKTEEDFYKTNNREDKQ
ncbi:MAG: hypothetical protein H8E55_08160 [Pelagibacterales bacterium]|nr:hypothetical protein [Pelagibacterales bacterium]